MQSVLKEMEENKTVSGRNCYITWIVVEADFFLLAVLSQPPVSKHKF
jgi:hypothetical protein